MEIWKSIDGYNGLYEVSNFGNVKRVSHKTKLKNGAIRTFDEKLKKQGTDKDGYKTVMLYIGRNKKLFKVHRLVALAFIDNPNNLPMINHKDENKANNNINNLEWCDVLYNNNYGTRNKRLSESKKGKKRTNITKDKKTGRFIRKAK